MTESIQKLNGIDFVLSFRTLKEKGITEDILPENLVNIFQTDKYEIILINSKYDIASNELNEQIEKLNTIVKSYDKDAIVAGEGPLTKDLVITYDTDYKYVNLFSIGCIFIVLWILLKSFSIPILLISTIEFAIFNNLGFSYFNGTVLPFIAPIILGTIQLGATIDYAILVTTNYINKRKNGLPKEDAMLKTMNYATPSILISGMCFFAATFGVGIYSKLAMIGAICTLISRGALISVGVVLLVLPSILLTFDKFIFRDKKDKGRRKMLNKKLKNVIAIILLCLLLPNSALALEKNEYIYGKLGYLGNVKSITVNKQIINNQKLDKIDDYAELENILNLKNNAKYTLENNKITWDANGNDIFYTGTTNKELPIDLKITYMLDDKEFSPEDIIGKSGNVTIKLKYINKDKHNNLYTPFVVTFGTIIDGKNNTNVIVQNGKVINNGSNYMVVGLATPGLYQSLNIKELKNMDTITISYQTNKFEISSMYSVITSKLIDSSDLSIFNKMDDLYNKIDTMQNSMNKIEKGAKELNKGLISLQSNYDTFNNGVNTISMNFYTLNNGVKELQTKVNNVLNNEKVIKFREMLPKLEEDATKIKNITNKYSDNIDKFINVSNNVVDGATKDILSIIAYLENVEEYLNNNTNYREIVQNNLSSLNDYLSSISMFLENIENYLNKFDTLSDFTSSSMDYIINAYEENPENADEKLTKLYYAAIKMKNSNELENIESSLNIDQNKLNELKTNINNAIDKLNTLANKLQVNNDKIINDLNDVKVVSNKLKDMENKVKNANTKIHNNINKIYDGIAAINKLPNEINAVNNGINEFENGINSLSEGTNKLYEGIKTLTNYSNQINDGNNKLSNGSSELAEGISKFNMEGINKLNSLVNNNVKKTVNNVKKLVELGNNYSSFTGSKDQNSSARFIMVTEELKAPEEKEEIKEVKKITLWDRIKGLFI